MVPRLRLRPAPKWPFTFSTLRIAPYGVRKPAGEQRHCSHGKKALQDAALFDATIVSTLVVRSRIRIVLDARSRNSSRVESKSQSQPGTRASSIRRGLASTNAYV